ncbi:MAG: FlgD immunoglobulin-like domain containing protein [Candidatus Eisenbacteria bacterium]
MRTLANGPLSAGVHTLRWDGADDAGHSVSAGVYFARVTADGAEDQVKLLRVR